MVEYGTEGNGLWVITAGQASVQIQAEGAGFIEVARLNGGDIVGDFTA